MPEALEQHSVTSPAEQLEEQETRSAAMTPEEYISLGRTLAAQGDREGALAAFRAATCSAKQPVAAAVTKAAARREARAARRREQAEEARREAAAAQERWEKAEAMRIAAFDNAIERGGLAAACALELSGEESTDEMPVTWAAARPPSPIAAINASKKATKKKKVVPVPRETRKQRRRAQQHNLLHGTKVATGDLAMSPEQWIQERQRLETEGLLMPVTHTAELEAVTHLLQSTLHRTPCVTRVFRVQNRGVYSRFHSTGADAYTDADRAELMFHGCRTLRNEVHIVRNGFQASEARSCRGGAVLPGTWFAAGAAYSDQGYAFVDKDGDRHLFICGVCKQEPKAVLLENSVMTVVKQDYAYPHYLVHYHR